MRHLQAGEWLFHAGDRGDALYVVISGRLDVLHPGPPPEIHRLACGEVLGELALLTGEPRSASVRAQRDAHLIRVSGDEFSALLLSEPGLAAGLANVLARRQLRKPTLGDARPPAPATLALVPLSSGLPMDRLRAELMRTLRRFGSVTELCGDRAVAAPGGAPWFDRLEQEHDQVLLVAAVPIRVTPGPRSARARPIGS